MCLKLSGRFVYVVSRKLTNQNIEKESMAEFNYYALGVDKGAKV